MLRALADTARLFTEGVTLDFSAGNVGENALRKWWAFRGEQEVLHSAAVGAIISAAKFGKREG